MNVDNSGEYHNYWLVEPRVEPRGLTLLRLAKKWLFEACNNFTYNSHSNTQFICSIPFSGHWSLGSSSGKEKNALRLDIYHSFFPLMVCRTKLCPVSPLIITELTLFHGQFEEGTNLHWKIIVPLHFKGSNCFYNIGKRELANNALVKCLKKTSEEPFTTQKRLMS